MKFSIFNFQFSKTGFTLIEIIVAIFVILVGIVGIYSLVPKIVSITTANINRFIAAQLAREGVEIVRNIRDGNWLEQRRDSLTPWNEGLDNCINGCEADYTILGEEDPILDSYQGRYLYIDSTDGFYKYISSPSVQDIKTKFKRKIIITQPQENKLNVKVQIFWAEKTNPFFELQENLYNWH